VSKKPTKKWQGLNPHRYEGNPLEHKLALAWEKLNAEKGPSNDKTLLDDLLTDYLLTTSWRSTGHERLIACTLIQWLGSPVGFGWLVDTLGLEVVRSMLARSEGGGVAVKPGQVYASQEKRYVGRKVVVECLRPRPPRNLLYRVGGNAHWTVRNSENGRRSYIYERILLSPNKWRLEA